MIGIVLTGGRSTRMGTNKAFLSLGPTSFAQRAADCLSPYCDRVCLVGGSDPEFDTIGLSHFPDDRPELGPLGGIATAFARLEAERLMVIPCDVPLLEPSTVQQILEADHQDIDAVIAGTDDGIQPLIGSYARRLKDRLDAYLMSGGRSVRTFLQGCTVRTVHMTTPDRKQNPFPFLNINSPADYDLLGRLRGQAAHSPKEKVVSSHPSQKQEH